MRAFAIAIVLVSCLMFLGPVQAGNANFMAFCLDGDGALSSWVTSRYEAYLSGTEHERTTHHRWEVWVQEAGGTMHVPVCAKLGDTAKPDTLKLENTCGRCVRFAVSRKNADGSLKRREIKLDANKSRFFRKLPNATVRVEGERDCSDTN
jgi:hypothetical protein